MGSGFRNNPITTVAGRGSDTVNKPDWNEFRTSFEGADGLCHQPVANTQGIINLAAAPGVRHAIRGVAWSYDAAPTGGRLTIVTNAVAVFEIDITAGGPGFIPFSPALASVRGMALTITLAAGGAGITGRLNVIGYWQE